MTLPWNEAWREVFSLSESYPPTVVAALAVATILAWMVLPAAVVFGYFDRKVGADLQARVGINRAGPHGVLQFVAEVVKLLEKSSASAKISRHMGWFLLYSLAIYSSVAALPIGPRLTLLDSDLSTLIPLWMAAVLALGSMLLGVETGGIPGTFGGLRLAAQTVAGIVPATLAVMTVGIKSGGLNWTLVVGAQGASPLAWNAVSGPLTFLAAGVFLVSGWIILSVFPFDSGISPPELGGGILFGSAGRRLGLFWFSRFFALFSWSMVAAALFFGGWQIPFGANESEFSGLFMVLHALAVLTKGFVLMAVWTVVARALPRLRTDQITGFSWRVLCPLALVALAAESLWAVLGGGPG